MSETGGPYEQRDESEDSHDFPYHRHEENPHAFDAIAAVSDDTDITSQLPRRPFYCTAWFIYLSSLLTMSVCGSAYAFSAWSSTLKAQFHYTQSQLEIVGYLGNAGGYVGPLCGLSAVLLSSFTNSAIAAVLVSLGYGIMALSANIDSETTFLHSPVIMGIGNGLIMSGITFAYSSIIHVNVMNLPRRQLARGLSALSMSFGLAATIFSALFNYACNGDLGRYLITAGVLTATLCSTNALTLRRVTGCDNTSASDSESHGHVTSLRATIRELAWLFRQPMFSVYFTFMFMIGGCAYVTINNTGQIIQSLNDGSTEANLTFVSVTLFSVANALGRLLVGLTDVLNVRRGWVAIISASLMLLAYTVAALFINQPSEWLAVIVLIGLSYGSHFAIVPVLITEFFGEHRLILSFGFIGCAPTLASLAFNAVAGHLYDRRASADTHVCIGTECWRVTFLMAIGASLAALAVGVICLNHSQTSDNHTPKKLSHSEATIVINSVETVD